MLATAVTAMPDSAPLSASVTLPAINADTSVPGLLAGSSLIVVRLLAPDSTGALFAMTFCANSEVSLRVRSVAVALITVAGQRRSRSASRKSWHFRSRQW